MPRITQAPYRLLATVILGFMELRLMGFAKRRSTHPTFISNINDLTAAVGWVEARNPSTPSSLFLRINGLSQHCFDGFRKRRSTHPTVLKNQEQAALDKSKLSITAKSLSSNLPSPFKS